MSKLPGLVAHADWSASAAKRWMARATLGPNGRYQAREPEPVGYLPTMIRSLANNAGPDRSVFLGFDFPIGLPSSYAKRAGVRDFVDLIPKLGHGKWADFYRVAEWAEEISLRRPFYPQQPGGTKHKHLLDGLGMGSFDELRRRCEKAQPGHPVACPLFWTLGAQQVGKAAISGWRDILEPALRASKNVVIWPFAGRLGALFHSRRVVIAETYPAEFYGHLGVSFPTSKAGSKSGKKVRADRAANAPRLLGWAEDAEVELGGALKDMIRDGFGWEEAGEDPFDAAVGLFGMLNVLLGRRDPGAPSDETVRRLEGWILGRASE